MLRERAPNVPAKTTRLRGPHYVLEQAIAPPDQDLRRSRSGTDILTNQKVPTQDDDPVTSGGMSSEEKPDIPAWLSQARGYQALPLTPSVPQPPAPQPALSQPTIPPPTLSQPPLPHTSTLKPSISQPSTSHTSMAQPLLPQTSTPHPPMSQPPMSHTPISNSSMSNHPISQTSLPQPSIPQLSAPQSSAGQSITSPESYATPQLPAAQDLFGISAAGSTWSGALSPFPSMGLHTTSHPPPCIPLVYGRAKGNETAAMVPLLPDRGPGPPPPPLPHSSDGYYQRAGGKRLPFPRIDQLYLPRPTTGSLHQ